ncbi:hypothetical protein PtB15_6B473 [Puccinia triticina]|nr:hypothetical protein PtB15_6B473 [Puccinia triticina]
MAAIGWSEDSTHLDILPQYRNEDAVRTDPEGYAKLIEDSARAGEALWDLFTTLGNVAAETRNAIRKLGGLNGPVSTLAFPSQAFWNNNTDDKHLNTIFSPRCEQCVDWSEESARRSQQFLIINCPLFILALSFC